MEQNTFQLYMNAARTCDSLDHGLYRTLLWSRVFLEIEVSSTSIVSRADMPRSA